MEIILIYRGFTEVSLGQETRGQNWSRIQAKHRAELGNKTLDYQYIKKNPENTQSNQKLNILGQKPRDANSATETFSMTPL